MTVFDVRGLEGAEITGEYFGANFLFTHDGLGDDGTYDELIEDLGVEHVRYPGGAITERYFDITDPDKTGGLSETGALLEFTPLSEFMEYAASEDLSVTIVLPTRNFLSEETDENGDRFPAFSEDDLREFVRDTIMGEYGNAKIDAFEIGNEYHYSGQMSSAEYGKLASQMSLVVKEEIIANANSSNGSREIAVIVQTGTNHGYAGLDEEYEALGDEADQLFAVIEDYNLDIDPEDFLFRGGDVNWGKLGNQIVLHQFIESGAIDAIDGVVSHVYSKEPAVPNSVDRGLKQISETWLEEREDLQLFVTEWNQKAATSVFDRDEDYGLLQAQELLNLVDTLSDYDAEMAHVWAVQQTSKTALSIGTDSEELTPAGELFKMMSENIRGMQQLSFQSMEESEAEEFPLDVHSYWGDEKLVMYFASNSEDETSNFIDLNTFIDSVGSVSVQILGVAEGEKPGSTFSEAVVEQLPGEEIFQDGIIEVELGAFEIMQVVFDEVQLTFQAEEVLAPSTEEPIRIEDIMVPEDTILFEEPNEPQEDAGSSFDFGLEWLAALLPLIGLVSAF